jgi:hypothetical protein
MTKVFICRALTATVAVAIVAAGIPPRAGAGALRRGARSPNAAAGTVGSGAPVAVGPRRDAANLLRFGALGYAAEPDSTADEFEFPEEEKSHLARDITIFVIVSAFVGFFLIKVFLEGDTDDSGGDGGGGKTVPAPVLR